MEWIKIEDKFPNEDELVWLYSENTKCIFLGSRVYLNNEGWFWSSIDSGTYVYKGLISGDCSIDDLDVTHWMPLPEPPK